MSFCFACDEELSNYNIYKLSQGGVQYRNWEKMEFKPETFEDGETIKWLCDSCANYAGISTRMMSKEQCSGPTCSERQFQPLSEINSSCVILVEYGSMRQSTKGPFQIFVTKDFGFLCYFCAVGMGLPLPQLYDEAYA